MNSNERIYAHGTLGNLKLEIGQEVIIKEFYDRDKTVIKDVKAKIIRFTDENSASYGTFIVRTIDKFDKIHSDLATGKKTLTKEEIEMPCNIGSITFDSFTKVNA